MAGEQMSRKSRLVLAWCLLMGLFMAYWPLVSIQAQDAGKDAAAQNQAAPANPPAPANGNNNAGSQKQKSYLEFFFEALTVRYTVAFFLISFTFVALVVMNLVAAKRDNMVPLALVEGFEEHLNEKRYQEAYELAKGDTSFLGKMLAEGMSRLSNGYPQAVDAMHAAGDDEMMKLEHSLSYISMVAAISPMVGLLGTVDGMVQAFAQIARENQTPSPQALANNVCTALITTLVGLVIAIPAVIVYSIIKNRYQRLGAEANMVSERLMSRFENVPAAAAKKA